MLLFTSVVAIPLVLCHAYALAASSSPTVNLHGASVVGRYHNLSNQETFRGIPYAEPPIGDLRLRPPQLKRRLNSPFDAGEFGPACTQPFASPLTPLSEDCLTLNIQRPAGTNRYSKLPVVVWIFGGSFLVGGTSGPEYNATNLVSYSVSRGTPIIYVNINYRLGPLGFPQGTDASDKGLLNLGLKDQLTAFRWVHDNIAAFGGDPKKVTLFGESAGAVSIGVHLLNPGIKKFVSGVILQSGALSTVGGRPELRNGDWTRFLDVTGCNQPGSDSWASYLPSVDGPRGLIPDVPSKVLGRLKFADLPLITGVNLDEGTGLTPESINSTQAIRERILSWYSGSAPSSERLSRLIDVLLDLYPDIPALGSPYGTGNETFGLSSQWKRMAAIFGDLLLVGPVRYHHEVLARAGARTYAYRFTEKQNGPPNWGAPGTRLPFLKQIDKPNDGLLDLIGSPLHILVLQMMAEERLVCLIPSCSRSSMKANIKTGENWLPYTSNHQFALRLDGDNLGMIPENYRARQLDFIMDNLGDVLGL
ncbi:hypothetical protein ONZ45_g14337 [Pleurotus djamor]|nr:hypothetical protein ONZ45_g14337 [Pleurotus djamor]